MNHKFKSPESVVWQTEPSTYRRSVRVAEEAEFFGKEKIVDLIRSIPESPEGKFRLSLLRGQVDLPIQCYPSLLVISARYC